MSRKPPQVLDRSTRSLACALDDTEVLSAAGELARVLQDIDRENDRALQVKADLKAKLAGLEAKRSNLALKVSRREEYRDVDVEKTLIVSKKEVAWIRLDTGEELDRRRANDAELDRKLDFKAPTS